MLLFRQMFPMFMCPPALADEFRAAGVHEVSEVSPDRVRLHLRKDGNGKILEDIRALFARSAENQAAARAQFITFVIDTLEFILSDLSPHAPPYERRIDEEVKRICSLKKVAMCRMTHQTPRVA